MYVLSQKELNKIGREYDRLDSLQRKINSDIQDPNKSTLAVTDVTDKLLKVHKEIYDLIIGEYGRRFVTYPGPLDQFNEECSQGWFGRKFPQRFGEFELTGSGEVYVIKPDVGSRGIIKPSLKTELSDLESTIEYFKLGIVGIINVEQIDSPIAIICQGTPIRRK